MKTHAMVRPRGVQSVHNGPREQSPAEVVATLTETVQDFIARNDRAIDDINSRLAANVVGGSHGEPGDSASIRSARAAFGGFAKTGQIPQAAMSTDSGPDGGFVTQPELERTITRRQADLSPMRRLARLVGTTSGEYQIPIARNGVESGWVAEREARPDTDSPQLILKNYPVHEVYANPSVTQKMLDDGVENLSAFLEEEIALAFDEKEGDAFLNGDGVNKPRGFLTYTKAATADATRDSGSMQFKETAGTGAIAPDDLIDILYTLRAGYRAGATWVMNSATAGKIRKLKDGQGNYIWSMATAAGETAQLLGYAVEIDEGMPDVATGAFPVAFGNFRRGYVIVDRSGIRVLRDALTNKPFVQFYTTKRVGGGMYDSNAIKLLKIKA